MVSDQPSAIAVLLALSDFIFLLRGFWFGGRSIIKRCECLFFLSCLTAQFAQMRGDRLPDLCFSYLLALVTESVRLLMH